MTSHVHWKPQPTHTNADLECMQALSEDNGDGDSSLRADQTVAKVDHFNLLQVSQGLEGRWWEKRERVGGEEDVPSKPTQSADEDAERASIPVPWPVLLS